MIKTILFGFIGGALGTIVTYIILLLIDLVKSKRNENG